MITTTQDPLTLANFRERTGHRFRVTNKQRARIYLTSLSDTDRANLVGAGSERVAEVVGKRNQTDKPFKWMELVSDYAENWSPDMALTRDEAFAEFIAEKGPERLQDRKPDVPLSVYQDPDLTLVNFTDKVEAATGSKRRFRLPSDLARKVETKEMTREQGFEATVRRILNNKNE